MALVGLCCPKPPLLELGPAHLRDRQGSAGDPGPGVEVTVFPPRAVRATDFRAMMRPSAIPLGTLFRHINEAVHRVSLLQSEIDVY